MCVHAGLPAKPAGRRGWSLTAASSVKSRASSTRFRSGLRSEARRNLDGFWGPDYTGKPEPAVILQDDAFEATASVTLCPFTTHLIDAPLVRLTVEPSDRNGLRASSQLMVDKITTVPRSKLGTYVGRMSDEEMASLQAEGVI